VTPAGQLPLVLSVDDDDVNQEVVEQTLGSEYRVVRAMSGMAAFEYLDSGKEFPSLMLLDVMMPGMTGFEVVSKIRNERKLSHSQLPVVILSARSPQDATANEAFQSGATDYMQKPFTSLVLKHRLSVMDKVRQEIRRAAAAERLAWQPQPQLPEPPHATQPFPQVGQQAQPECTTQQQASVAGPPGSQAMSERFAAELAERAKAMEELLLERDGLKSSLEAAKAANAQAVAELKRMADDRERLRLSLGTRPSPASTMEPNTERSKAFSWNSTGSGGSRENKERMIHQKAQQSDTGWSRFIDQHAPTSGSDAEFYQNEVHCRDRELATLLNNLSRKKAEAWLQRQRADALDRELAFLRHSSRLPRSAARSSA